MLVDLVSLVAGVAFVTVFLLASMVLFVVVRGWVRGRTSFDELGVMDRVIRWSVFFVAPWMLFVSYSLTQDPLFLWIGIHILDHLQIGFEFFGWLYNIAVLSLWFSVFYLPMAVVYSRVRLDYPEEARMYLYGSLGYLAWLLLFNLGADTTPPLLFDGQTFVVGLVMIPLLTALVGYMLTRAWRDGEDGLFRCTLLMYSPAIAVLVITSFFYLLTVTDLLQLG